MCVYPNDCVFAFNKKELAFGILWIVLNTTKSRKIGAAWLPDSLASVARSLIVTDLNLSEEMSVLRTYFKYWTTTDSLYYVFRANELHLLWRDYLSHGRDLQLQDD